MKIQNPFKFQNWKFKRFLIIILSIQLSLLGLFILNNFGVNIPIIRELVGFFYVFFVPGYLLLRILRLHNLDSAESFFYAIGLSIVTDMFFGFLLDIFYPALGITNKPISEIPIVFAMTFFVFLLCIAAYFSDKDYDNPDFIELKDIVNLQILILGLIPFMVVFGTYLVNYYHNNILLITMIITTALILLIVGFTNWINKKYYPYVVWIISISLVWHIGLITNYVINVDHELVHSILVIKSGFWDPNKYDPTNSNTILITNIFVPLIYFILSINVTNIYKIIFPTLLSIFPVITYFIFRRYINEKSSFFSTFLFIVFKKGSTIFFIQFIKQPIAMVFLSLILLVLYNKNIQYSKRLLLSLLFGIGVIWSHYGTSYFFMIGLIFTMFFVGVFIVAGFISRKENLKVFFSFGIIYILLVISWYMYISSSSFFYSLAIFGNRTFSALWTEFLSPKASRGAYYIAEQLSGLDLMLKYMDLEILFFIILGILKVLYDFTIKKDPKFDAFYLGLSIYFIILLVASVVLPYFAVMSPGRLLAIALIILSPFFIIGGELVFKVMFNKVFRVHVRSSIILRVLGCYVIILMLLSTGVTHEILKSHPFSIALSQNSVDEYGSIRSKGEFYRQFISEYDVTAIRWLGFYKKYNILYYTCKNTLIEEVPLYYGSTEFKNINLDIHTKITNNSYLWKTYANIKGDIAFASNLGVYYSIYYNFSKISYKYKDASRIYDNSGSQLFYKT